ncbi:MAG: hypothetical protein U0270_13140 [Labilithrix sp.]
MRSPFLLATVAVAASLLTASAASADVFVECPPGSYRMDEKGFSWCQPTVCENDSMCNPNILCRPLGLCMMVGTLSKPGEPDGGQRLMVTQLCGEDKTCPQNQTCSMLGRCLTADNATKLGVIDKKPGAPAPSAAPSATPATPAEGKKSSCGCSVIGAPESERATVVSLGAVALSALLVRARRRGSRRKSR